MCVPHPERAWRRGFGGTMVRAGMYRLGTIDMMGYDARIPGDCVLLQSGAKQSQNCSARPSIPDTEWRRWHMMVGAISMIDVGAACTFGSNAAPMARRNGACS